MARLADKIAIVTGAGNGIGLAMAKLFAEEGAHVYVTDLEGSAAAEAVADITARGLKATAMTVDVSRGQDVLALFRAVESAHGKADIIVNNAGLMVRSDFRHLSDADWERIRDVNLDGVVRIARDGFKLLHAARTGSLINIASIMGQRGLRQVAAYTATKAAVTALTKALAVEYASSGIRVNSIAPGYVDTAMTGRFIKNPFVSKALLEKTPMRRFGTVDEIAKAALFFASDESSYCTGSELVVDGGMTAGLL